MTNTPTAATPRSALTALHETIAHDTTHAPPPIPRAHISGARDYTDETQHASKRDKKAMKRDESRKRAHIHDEHSHNHGYAQRAHRLTRNDRAPHDKRAAPPLSSAIPAAHEITNTKHNTRQNRTKYMETSES